MALPDPGVSTVLTARSDRVRAARRLTRRRTRERTGMFLAEGPQAVRESLAGAAVEVFLGQDAAGRHDDLVDTARARGIAVRVVTDDALTSLCGTVTPQGVVAVCRMTVTGVSEVLLARPSLAVMLVEDRDPGNVGTIVRTADAAGAGAVLLSRTCVDPYNGKAVRSSAGSVFHVPLVTGVEPVDVMGQATDQDWQVCAADVGGEVALDRLRLDGRPVMWVFGSEAHGVPSEVRGAADARVRIPMYGRAESLNVAAAAAICLYATAQAQACAHRQAQQAAQQAQQAPAQEAP